MILIEQSQIPDVDEISDVPLDDMIKVYKTCQELQEICERENGIGISAVQVGIPWKLFLVKGDGSCPLIPAGEYGYFLNCSYEKVTDEKQVVSIEGCLSIRSPEGQLRLFEVKRSDKIRLYGFRINNNDLSIVEIDDALTMKQQGIVFQHEIDHHFGILISDIGKEIFVW
jgi:peptide deformylase